jgi:hypothetical protein
MKEINRYIIPVKIGQVKSLCWHGDELVDWAMGGVRYRLDATSTDMRVSFRYKFDKAVALPNSDYSVIFESRGTKGLILNDLRLVREINRSYYCAEAYEYPVVLFRLPNGRAVIAHCPDEYNQIEIEDIETDERLSTRTGEPADFFHSRLQVSPDGRYLLSSGWQWSPFDSIALYEVEKVLVAPSLLDDGITYPRVDDEILEIHSAAFNDDENLVFSTVIENDESPAVGIFNISESRVKQFARVTETVGTIMPLGEFVVGFYEHPKLIELSTGKILYRWEELSTGKQNSSIIRNLDAIPPIALDPARKRFAVVSSETITVIELG